MILLASNIGPKGLYLMFAWLVSAALGAWLADRKGYGERVGLTLGLVLTVVGLLIVLLLPGRPGSKWRVEGWLPRSWLSRGPLRLLGRRSELPKPE
jgi:hypothetical protein